VLSTIGRNIRKLRTEGGMTLQGLADRTKLSPSMLSLLERGKTGPSIGTLVVIAASLGAQMSDLMGHAGSASDDMVSRVRDQPVIQTQPGVKRRILKQDQARAIEIAINEYEPGTSSAPAPHAHEGYEYGVVLDGVLEVTVDDQVQVLRPGDLISYPSPHPHRFANSGGKPVRTLWINLRRP
jgi:quercetin dioxygenase-like cupin family protein